MHYLHCLLDHYKSINRIENSASVDGGLSGGSSVRGPPSALAEILVLVVTTDDICLIKGPFLFIDIFIYDMLLIYNGLTSNANNAHNYARPYSTITPITITILFPFLWTK